MSLYLGVDVALDIISKQYKSGVCLAWPGGWQQSGTARIYNVCVGRDQVGGGEGGTEGGGVEEI